MNYVINLNKPEGISSHTAVQKVKSTLNLRKAGHTGTLDPIATGVLIVCCNSATKISDYISGLNKEYIVTMKLGSQTDTLDREGKTIGEKDPSSVTQEMVIEATKKFIGTISQAPPMFSAKKHRGIPLYKIARRGIEIERKKKKVHIQGIDLISFKNPLITLRVASSKGTYIRTLCSDIAEALGTYAYVYSLLRTKIGMFFIDNSIDIDHISELSHGSITDQDCIFTIDKALSHLDKLKLTKDEIKRITNGIVLDKKNPNNGDTLFRLKDSHDRLIGVGNFSSNGLRLKTLLR